MLIDTKDRYHVLIAIFFLKPSFKLKTQKLIFVLKQAVVIHEIPNLTTPDIFTYYLR